MLRSNFSCVDFYFLLLIETPAADEVEVYQTMQACLEMRQNYVFKEAVASWEKEVILDPSTPKPNLNPFDYTPEGKSEVSSYLLFLLDMRVNF